MGFSLRFKIIFLAVVILVITIGATTLASGYVFSQEYADVLQSRTLIIGQGLKSQLDRLLELGIPLEELVGFEKQLQDTVTTYPDIAYAMVIDLDSKILFHNDPSQHNKILADTMTVDAVKRGTTVIQVHSDQQGQFYDIFIPILDRSGDHVGAIRIGFPVELISQKTSWLAVFSGGVATISLGITVALLVFALSILVTNPLLKLLTAIEEFRRGGTGLATRVEIDSSDEIGQLGSAFNSMASQLHDLIGTLEEQVTSRTRQLETVMEIAQQLAVILDLNELLRQIVILTKENFDYYHVHIYLFDKMTRSLQLVEGYGQAGAEMKRQGHNIAIDTEQSLVAQTAREGQLNTVEDVQTNPNWLPNRLLPDTKSEMAVPILLGNEVFGVLDVQSDKVGGLTRDDEVALKALANQAAVALNNARLFEETIQTKDEAEKAREEAEKTREEAEKTREEADKARAEAEQAKEEAEVINKTMEVQIWQTTGQTQLNEKMRGEQDIRMLANSIIQQVCHYLQVQTGILYLAEGQYLKPMGRYAYSQIKPTDRFKFGEDFVGQAALEKRRLFVKNVPEGYLTVRSGLGKRAPKNIMLFPFIHNDRVVGVIELGTLNDFSQAQMEFMETALDTIAIAFNTAQDRARIDELLAQTRQQTEDLETQEETLEMQTENGSPRRK
jgi:GAF domain-containing protein/HAMP domain-containing protein